MPSAPIAMTAAMLLIGEHDDAGKADGRPGQHCPPSLPVDALEDRARKGVPVELLLRLPKQRLQPGVVVVIHDAVPPGSL